MMKGCFNFIKNNMYDNECAYIHTIKCVFTLIQEKRDLITGLKTRTNAGRPDWDKVFRQIKSQGHNRVTVFYCGNPNVSDQISQKCDEFGFTFKKEIF